jgi:hypothetical protein
LEFLSFKKTKILTRETRIKSTLTPKTTNSASKSQHRLGICSDERKQFATKSVFEIVRSKIAVFDFCSDFQLTHFDKCSN